MSPSLQRNALLLLLLAGLGFRLHGVLFLKTGLSHDESVSYLCASATQGAYARDMPAMRDRAVTAADIHAFYRRPAHPDPALVAHDLALYDIHPPLYFWALHAVQWAFGFDPRSGVLVNVLAGLAMLLMLYRIGRATLGGPIPALAACVLWYLSPAVAQADLEARHYQFLGLLALASLWLGKGAASGRASTGHWALFTVVNACGFLTHYYFGFLLVPGAVMVLARHRLGPATFRYLGSLVLSLAFFLLLFPGFLDFLDGISRYRDNNLAPDIPLTDRVRTMVYASLGFFTWWGWARHGFLAVAALVVGWALVARVRSASSPMKGPMAWYGAHLAWHVSFTALLYLLGTSPPNAVGGQYFAYFWPLLSLFIVHWALRAPPVVRRVLLPAYALQLAVSCFLSIKGSGHLRNTLPLAWYGKMNASSILVTNETRRSGLPRIALHLDPGTRLLPLSRQGMEEALPALEGDVAFLYSGRAGGTPDAVVASLSGNGAVHTVDSVKHYQLHLFRR